MSDIALAAQEQQAAMGGSLFTDLFNTPVNQPLDSPSSGGMTYADQVLLGGAFPVLRDKTVQEEMEGRFEATESLADNAYMVLSQIQELVPPEQQADVTAEFSGIPHDRGTLGAARSANPDSANSQFFINFNDNHFLNRQYTVYGRVISGMEFVDALERGEPPASPDKMISVVVAADA